MWVHLPNGRSSRRSYTMLGQCGRKPRDRWISTTPALEDDSNVTPCILSAVFRGSLSRSTPMSAGGQRDGIQARHPWAHERIREIQTIHRGIGPTWSGWIPWSNHSRTWLLRLHLEKDRGTSHRYCTQTLKFRLQARILQHLANNLFKSKQGWQVIS